MLSDEQIELAALDKQYKDLQGESFEPSNPR